jgi:NADH-quinone oxidoreductase subunit J
MELTVFIISAAIVLGGAVGVIASRNPVHSALFLVQTLFGVAVLFILLEAPFLAAIQVIVYAGAIVILFLFVLMLLGVDQAEDLSIDPVGGLRPLAVVVGAAILGSVLAVLLAATDAITGARAANEAIDPAVSDVRQLGRSLFTDHVVAFELTAVLLTIAVVGAVVFARRVRGELEPIPETRSLAEEIALERALDADGTDEEASH